MMKAIRSRYQAGDGLLSRLQPELLLTANSSRELVVKSSLLAVDVSTTWVETGGLMSYGPDRIAMYRACRCLR